MQGLERDSGTIFRVDPWHTKVGNGHAMVPGRPTMPYRMGRLKRQGTQKAEREQKSADAPLTHPSAHARSHDVLRVHPNFSLSSANTPSERKIPVPPD